MTTTIPAITTPLTLGFWGAILAILPQVIDAMHVIAASPALPPHVTGIVSAIGALIAIWSTRHAKKKATGQA